MIFVKSILFDKTDKNYEISVSKWTPLPSFSLCHSTSKVA